MSKKGIEFKINISRENIAALGKVLHYYFFFKEKQKYGTTFQYDELDPNCVNI